MMFETYLNLSWAWVAKKYRIVFIIHTASFPTIEDAPFNYLWVSTTNSVNPTILQLLEIVLLERQPLDLAFVSRIWEKPGFLFFCFYFLPLSS